MNNAIVALAKKDLLLLVRDKAGLFFALGFPLVMAVFFGTIFGGGGGGGSSEPAGIAVAAVDEDASDVSAAFIDELDAGGDFVITRSGSRESALDAVRTGRQSAAVIVTEGFGEARERVFWGDPATIEIVYDPSRGAESAMIEGMLMKQAFEGMGSMFTDADAMRKNNAAAVEALNADTEMGPLAKGSLRVLLGAVDTFFATGQESWMQEEEGGSATDQVQWQPVVIESVSVRDVGTAENTEENADAGPGSGYDVSFPQGVMWALIGVSAGFGISLVQERGSGTLRRLRVAPISRGQVLMGKALACFTSIVFATALLMVIAVVVFGVRPTSVPLLIVGVACAGVCFTGIMMLLSVLGKTEQAAAGIGWAVMLFLAMFGGAMVPLFIMPGWMQSMASFSPVKWAILAVEGPLWRGFGVGEMVVPCLILLGVGVVAFGVGAGLFGRMEES